MSLPKLEIWRAELEARIVALDAQLAPIERELGRTKQQLDLVQRLLHLEGGTGEEPVKAPVVPPILNGAPVIEVIAGILRDSAQPLHITEIRRRYLATGRTIPGQGTESNLLAYMTRSPHFERVAKGTYRLAAVPSSRLKAQKVGVRWKGREGWCHAGSETGLVLCAARRR